MESHESEAGLPGEACLDSVNKPMSMSRQTNVQTSALLTKPMLEQVCFNILRDMCSIFTLL